MAAILAPTKRILTSLLSKTLSPSSSRSRLALLCIFNQHLLYPSPPHSSFTMPTRYKTSESGYSPLNDPSPNSSNQPLKDTIRLEGCDYEHWLIVMEFPSETKPSEDEMINSYIKTLASVLGSEEEAKQKIYSVNTRTYTGFGALISEELSDKVKGLPGVLWVLPDSYLDVPNKDYGGDLFVDGKVIHRPQYWCNESQQSSRRGFRPRYDQRQRTMPVERRLPLQGNNTSLLQQGGPVQQPPPAPGSTVPVPPQVVEVASL